MTTSSDDLAGLRRAAEAATPGGWEVCAFDSGHSKFEMSVFVVTQELGDQICDMDGLARWNNERDAKDDGYADARFIAAANPATVLALLDDLAAAQTQLAAVRALMQDAVNEHQPHAIAPFVFVDELRAALAEGPAPETTPPECLGCTFPALPSGKWCAACAAESQPSSTDSRPPKSTERDERGSASTRVSPERSTGNSGPRR